MLSEICEEIRNYFPSENGIHMGTFEIIGGSITPIDFLQYGQYFRIVGSIFNDGVHKYPASDLMDEMFYGAVWAMAVPPSLIDLASDVEKYVETVDNNPSPYTSESFGGYSYTKATDSDGNTMSWKKAFANRLNKYRRI